VRLWYANTGELAQELVGHRDAVTVVAFSPAGNVLATGARDRLAYLWFLGEPADTSIQASKKQEGHVPQVQMNASPAGATHTRDSNTINLGSPQNPPSQNSSTIRGLLARQKIQRLLSVSTRVRIDMLRDYLQMDKVDFTGQLVDWAVEYGFTIDGDYINIEGGNVNGFMKNLDAMYTSWEGKEKAKDGKI
jgi:WD40 repeat protein